MDLSEEDIQEIEEGVEAMARSDEKTRRRYEEFGYLYRKEKEEAAE